jgi:hypothetical protein
MHTAKVKWLNSRKKMDQVIQKNVVMVKKWENLVRPVAPLEIDSNFASILHDLASGSIQKNDIASHGRGYDSPAVSIAELPTALRRSGINSIRTGPRGITEAAFGCDSQNL